MPITMTNCRVSDCGTFLSAPEGALLPEIRLSGTTLERIGTMVEVRCSADPEKSKQVIAQIIDELQGREATPESVESAAKQRGVLSFLKENGFNLADLAIKLATLGS